MARIYSSTNDGASSEVPAVHEGGWNNYCVYNAHQQRSLPTEVQHIQVYQGEEALHCGPTHVNKAPDPSNRCGSW